MKHDKAIELAEALESGKYAQCKGVLAAGRGEDRRFCCLGVASELIGDLQDNNKNSVDDNLGLSQTAMDYYGFSDREGKFSATSVEINEQSIDCLSLLNDNGWTFPQIAAFIRERWKDL